MPEGMTTDRSTISATRRRCTPWCCVVSCVQAFTVTIKTPLTHSFMEDRQPPVYHTLLTTLRPATNKWRFLLGSSDDTKSIIGFAPRALKKGASRPEAYPPSSPPPKHSPLSVTDGPSESRDTRWPAKVIKYSS